MSEIEVLEKIASCLVGIGCELGIICITLWLMLVFKDMGGK